MNESELEREAMAKSAVARDMTAEKLLDAAVPGFLAECSPEEAEEMGAFAEEAMDMDDAVEGSFDPRGTLNEKGNDNA